MIVLGLTGFTAARRADATAAAAMLAPKSSPWSWIGFYVGAHIGGAEGIVSYAVPQRFSLGLGGRYWSMWTNNNAITNFGGTSCTCPNEPAKTELYGGFVQGFYRFDPATLF